MSASKLGTAEALLQHAVALVRIADGQCSRHELRSKDAFGTTLAERLETAATSLDVLISTLQAIRTRRSTRRGP